MNTITLNEFFTHFKRYVVTILNGEKIMIYNGKLSYGKKDLHKENKKRPFGLCKGEFSIPDNFNDPLPDDIVNTFYQ